MNKTTAMKIKDLLTVLLLTLSISTMAQVAKPLADVNGVNDVTFDSLAKAQTARIEPGTSRRGNNPVLFLIGNSTMRNGTLGNGNNGQWGWGYFTHKYFDENKITVENQALGGMSSRTFYNRLWQPIRQAIRPDDWVIISIGHNDNGPYDSGRARASIPGTGNDSLCVTIKETGVKETIYTYGGYMRMYINDVRRAGGHPILMSLTPRDAYDDNGKIVRTRHTEWLKEVSRQENVPFIDLCEISASKLDRYGRWKEQYHFFTDHIHTSKFGAEMNARSAAEGLAASADPQLAPLQAMMQNIKPDTYDIDRSTGKPTVFITGDSTVKNEDSKPDGMWGWGALANTIFNDKKINIVNAAKAGRSLRSYLNEGRWDKVVNSLQPGDFVLIEFGHNDIGKIDEQKYRACIATAKDTCHVYKLKDFKPMNGANTEYEVVYSFGWYLKKYIQDVREHGATPIIVSLTPRNEWKDGKIERRNDTYGAWYRQIAEETGTEFVDLHNITADYLDKKCGSKEKAMKYYCHDHTHTSRIGATVNAQSVSKGLKKNKGALTKYLK